MGNGLADELGFEYFEFANCDLFHAKTKYYFCKNVFKA